MRSKETEFEKFDRVVGGLLTVPYSELQKKLAEEKKAKAKSKKKQSTSAASRVSGVRKKRLG